MLLDALAPLFIGLHNVLSLVGSGQPTSPPRTTTDYIKLHGYPVQNHYVNTSDGYILNIHRIPSTKVGQKNGKVALLNHGLQASSVFWVMTGPEKGLGYVLADEGYDVWMLNSRGNIYSRSHMMLNPDNDAEYWNFSWHEIGVNDLPATINYILKETNQTGVYYVGHSQGTTSMFVLTSMLPEYNQRIKGYISLAPVAFMQHTKNMVFTILAAIMSISESFLQILIGEYEILKFDSSFHHSLFTLCSTNFENYLCEMFLNNGFGSSPVQRNRTLIPDMFFHAPSGSSYKQATHYFQEMYSGHFRQYDHQIEGNNRVYKRSTSPDYDLSQITAPGCFIYSDIDIFCDHKQDIPRLAQALRRRPEMHFIANFNHVDYLLGIDAPKLVNSKIIKFFSQN